MDWGFLHRDFLLEGSDREASANAGKHKTANLDDYVHPL